MSALNGNAPLDLSDFEYYSYRDDSFDHPMVMVLRIHLEGSLDVACFRRSVKLALRHHPLLRSKIRQRGRQFHWVAAEGQPIQISCRSFETAYPPTDCPLARFDLKNESGARFDLRVSRDRSVLVAYFHHACVDGIGAIGFLADVFAEYGQHTTAVDADCPELSFPDPAILPLRGRCPELGIVDGKRKSWRDWLRGPSKFLLGKNYSIRNRRDNDVPANDAANILHTAVLPRTTVRQLKKLASIKQVSTNDLCMMAYLQQISQWTQAADDRARDADLFRILMPVSMRTPDLDAISASNVLSYVFQTFRRRECRNPEALLAAINRRTTDMLYSNEGAVLLKLFALVRRVPGLFQFSRWLQPSFATAVLANVGDLRRVFASRFTLQAGRVVAGNIKIQQIDGIAPLRKNTNVAISFGAYGGDLILNLRADPRALSESSAILFLNQVVDRLAEMAETQTLSSSARTGKASVPKSNTVGSATN